MPSASHLEEARKSKADALGHLLSLQREDGCWEGEVVWCPIILAQYVMVRNLLGTGAFDDATRAGMIQHFRVTQTSAGGWGLHLESPPYVYVTALSYVALRLLGVGPEDPLTTRAREWLEQQPRGILAIPSWGKFWLAMLDLYGYEGLNPCPPELFLLPRWLPFHPSRFYCHTRYIYLGIAYLYGRRYRGKLGSIVEELRSELYQQPYDTIDFAAHRHDLAAGDVLVRPGAGLRLIWNILYRCEGLLSGTALRKRALDNCFERILYEQRTSRYQAISPVNGLLNCLAIGSSGLDHPELAPSLQGVEAWKWADPEDGIRYAGARSNTWDTGFALQSLLENPQASETAAPAVRRAYAFLRDTQIITEIPDHVAENRDPALGGWCFSDGRHRWPVSDCTAEALCAVLQSHQSPDLLGDTMRIPDHRLREAAEFLLRHQNSDGGFGTYERRRGAAWLESCNPSEMFANCMTELSYVECTASSVKGLARYRAAYPDSLKGSSELAITRGVRFLRQQQLADGSFAGCWGINFTYGTFFVVESLRAAGVAADDPALLRAAEWLIAHQRTDGGWGEHYSSCLLNRYIEHSASQVVMTSWALLALLEIVGPDHDAVARGFRWLEARQNVDGSWPREGVNGVFFGSAMLDYRLYTSYFPAWALARRDRLHGRSACLK